MPAREEIKSQLYQVEEGWLELYDGLRFDFGNETIDLSNLTVEIIAHSLSQLCRYNGHTRRYYSVGEHACLLSDYVMHQPWATPRDGLTALHHDDAESLLGEVVRPIKERLPTFKELEARIDQALAERFDTEWPLPDWFKPLDTRIICDERAQVMCPSNNEWSADSLEPLGIRTWRLTGRWPWLVKQRFLYRHLKLTRLTKR